MVLSKHLGAMSDTLGCWTDKRIIYRGMKLRGAGEGCEPFANEFDTHISPQIGYLMKLYIAVLDEVPDFIVPTLVAHTVLNAHIKFAHMETYTTWLKDSYKKCVIKVNKKEFEKIANIPDTVVGFESTVLDGNICCAIPVPSTNIPNVLKFAKLWKPNGSTI